MKTVMFAAVVAVTMGAGAVELVECPKCDRWMRISDDGLSATVNVSRLKDDAPDKATLDRRVAEMTARAEKYLAFGRNVATGDRRCPLMRWSSWNTFGVGAGLYGHDAADCNLHFVDLGFVRDLPT